MSKQLLHCFGCDAGGDVFTLVHAKEGLDFRAALKLLGSAATFYATHLGSGTREARGIAGRSASWVGVRVPALNGYANLVFQAVSSMGAAGFEPATSLVRSQDRPALVDGVECLRQSAIGSVPLLSGDRYSSYT